jgi:uncharacterized membrane protein
VVEERALTARIMMRIFMVVVVVVVVVVAVMTMMMVLGHLPVEWMISGQGQCLAAQGQAWVPPFSSTESYRYA